MLKADYFTEAYEYTAFVNANPNIKIISILTFDSKIVVTWEE